MRKGIWETCVLGVALLVAAGCTLPDYFSLNFFQSGGSGNDRITVGSLETISASTKSSLEKMGMSVKQDQQGEDLRFVVRAKSGEQFSLVFSRVQSDRGEQTRVRMESGTADHKDIIFNLLAKLEEQKTH